MSAWVCKVHIRPLSAISASRCQALFTDPVNAPFWHSALDQCEIAHCVHAIGAGAAISSRMEARQLVAYLLIALTLAALVAVWRYATRERRAERRAHRRWLARKRDRVESRDS
jgi:uncharacterized membrane protein YfcA